MDVSKGQFQEKDRRRLHEVMQDAPPWTDLIQLDGVGLVRNESKHPDGCFECDGGHLMAE